MEHSLRTMFAVPGNTRDIHAVFENKLIPIHVPT